MGKVVVRIPNHLGDCIMALPGILSLIASRPEDEFHLLAPMWAESLYRSAGSFTFLPVHQSRLHGLPAIRYQVPLLRQGRYDTGVLMTPSFSSALIFLLGGVKHRYGFAADHRDFALNHPVAGYPVTRHRSDEFVKLLESFCNDTLTVDLPRVEVSPAAQSGALTMLEKTSVDLRSGFAVIAPCAIARSRRWGADNYAQLARRLVRDLGIGVFLVGTREEFDDGEIIADADKNICNLCGQTDIELAAAVLAQARLFVGNDSGLAHLAAAIDIPLVVLSGADNPAETSPLSRKKTVIIKDHLDCISCVKNACPLPGDQFMRCMRGITVDEVFNAASVRLERT
ncbi:MAG: lipopolysaccharide heptosyltransferase II [Candidatus Zixiibacteriota bacterium]|nr:MAG: lipopolysaccharide heptosyltransferase II [candidate division Zixibacteria bacterium]